MTDPVVRILQAYNFKCEYWLERTIAVNSGGRIPKTVTMMLGGKSCLRDLSMRIRPFDVLDRAFTFT